MNTHEKWAGIVTVTLWFHTPRHIEQIRQSIDMLRSINIHKIFVVQDIKTKIPLDTFAAADVEVLSADVFETCQKWYIGLSKAFAEGFERGFVFPGDLEQYEGKNLPEEPALREKLVGKLAAMLADPADLVIGDYSVPHSDRNPKQHLSQSGAFLLLKEFFPAEAEEIAEKGILFPRSEFFILSRRAFAGFFGTEYYAKWMPWEATLQLLVFASRSHLPFSRHYLGEIGDTAVKRANDYEIANQLMRMEYTIFYEYLKYHGYQTSESSLPAGWLTHLKHSFKLISNFFTDNFVVTIDGPTAAGKSSVAKAIARKLNFLYVDGGIFFRALTLKAIQQNLNLDDEQALLDLSAELDLQIEKGQANDLVEYRILLDGRDVTGEVRTPQVSAQVPHVSRHAGVREQRKAWVRGLAKNNNIVAEGRLLGSEVFPSANVKFALDASLEARAARRHRQLHEAGSQLSSAHIEDAIVQRDTLDSTTGPIDRLERQPDAIYLDSSSLSIDEVVNILIENIQPAYELWKTQKERNGW